MTDSDAPDPFRTGPQWSPAVTALLVIVAMEALVGGLSYLTQTWVVGLGGGIGLVLLCGMRAAQVRGERRLLVLLLTPLLAGGASLVAAMSLAELGALHGRGLVRGIPVTEAPLHPEAGGFKFVDATLRPELRGVATEVAYERTGRGEFSSSRKHTYSYTVAPVVPEGWSRRDPVPAWVGCSRDCSAEWAQPLRGGLRIVDDREYFSAAVDAAVAEHGLRNAEHAPILEWVEDPAEAIRERWQVAGILLALPFLVALGVWVGTRRRRVAPL